MSVYRFISAEKARTPVSVCCRLLGVSRSGFYDWAGRAPSDRQLTDAWLVEQIKRIHAENRGVYGARRVHAELRLAEGVFVGRKRVERLMRHAGLSGLHKRRRGRTTIRVQGVTTAPDSWRATSTAIDRLWCADMTYIRTWEGWLYLASVMDCYSRRIVGWAMAEGPAAPAPTGSTCTSSDVSVALATIRVIGPAPTRVGEIATRWALIEAVTVDGDGGRGSFA